MYPVRRQEVHLRIGQRIFHQQHERGLTEVILQMSTYGGMPVCIEGLAVLREVLEKAASRQT
jgi:hypothetical protein